MAPCNHYEFFKLALIDSKEGLEVSSPLKKKMLDFPLIQGSLNIHEMDAMRADLLAQEKSHQSKPIENSAWGGIDRLDCPE